MQATIIDAWNKAFQFLTVNHGTQARKDIEVMRSEMIKLSQIIVKQQADNQAQNERMNKEIAELKDLILFDDKPSEKLKIARERLAERERKEPKQ